MSSAAKVVYDEAYYASHCGSIPYARTDHWLNFFGSVADALVRSFTPSRVFDAGCAIGLLVECLWDRGVETHGRDISAWAIDQIRADVRPWCAVGSIADPIDGHYDLITCIEVLEHLAEADALRAITALSTAAPRILFSSSPTDLTEPTHVNVRPPAYWLALWAQAGFAPSVTHDAGYLAPHAYILERSDEGRSKRDLVAFADRIRHRVALAQVGSAMLDARSQLAECRQLVESLRSQLSSARSLNDSGTENVDLLQGDLAQALTRLERETTARRSAESQIVSLRRDADSGRHPLLSDQHAHRDILASAAWRATAAAQTASQMLPTPMRRLAHRLLQTGKLSSAGRIAGRLRDRARNNERARLVAASPLFDAAWYLARNPDVATSGIAPALHYAQSGEAEGREPGPAFNARQTLRDSMSARLQSAPLPSRTATDRPFVAALPRPGAVSPEGVTAPPIELMRAARFPDLTPLPVFAAPHAAGRRLTVVTDSINVGSLYGGVGTALIFAVLAAERMRATLRLVTRTEAPHADGVANILKVHGINWEGNIDFVYAPRQPTPGGHDLPAFDGDLFLTTSWWATWSARQSVPKARIAYLLQEDERMFYPHGDDHLQCAETLADPDLLYIVNSALLLDHLQAEGLAPRGTAFEPSFPGSLYYPAPSGTRAANGKRDFFFYARPNNARNLYWRGLEVVCAAIEEGVLDPDEWNFHFAGHGTNPVALPRGAKPLLPGPMAWHEYAAFIRRMEVGLSLMYTPHPSYPPLDIAASGGIVVTNRFGRKRDLDRYCANIICADADVGSLVTGLRQAVALSSDLALRRTNFDGSRLQRDWAKSMEPALDRLVAWAGE